MSGSSASALNWYSRRLAGELAKDRRVAVVAPRFGSNSTKWTDGEVDVYPTFVRGSLIGLVHAVCAVRRIGARVVHVQHELFAFGGILTAFLLPLALGYLRLRGHKVITTIHGVIPLSELSREFMRANRIPGHPVIARAVWRILIRSVAGASDRVVVHEFFLRDLLAEEYGTAAEVIVVPLGIEPLSAAPSRAEARARLGIPESAEVALFFGYLAAYKGIDYLLTELPELLRRRPAIHVVIAGAIPQRLRDGVTGDLVRELERFPDRVHILGFIADDLVASVFAAADVLLLPYTVAMSSSGPMALAVGYDIPVLLSDAFKRTFPEAPLFFSLRRGALNSAIDELFNERSGLASMSRKFLSDLRESRAWPRIAHTLGSIYESISSCG